MERKIYMLSTDDYRRHKGGRNKVLSVLKLHKDPDDEVYAYRHDEVSALADIGGYMAVTRANHCMNIEMIEPDEIFLFYTPETTENLENFDQLCENALARKIPVRLFNIGE